MRGVRRPRSESALRIRRAERFRARVIEPFIEAYARGRPPIPACGLHDHVKFDWLLDRARKLGAGGW